MNPRAKNLFEQGVAAARAKQLQTTLNLFSAAIAADPKSIALANQAAVILTTLGALPAAHKILEDAARRFPNDAGTASNLGTVSISLGRADQAIACWRRAVEIDPNFADAHYNLANLLRQRLEYDEAEQALRALLARHPGMHEAWHLLGNIRRHLGDCPDAIACLQRAIEANPNDEVSQSALLFTLLFADHITWHETIARQVEWGNRFPAPLNRFDNLRDRDRRLKIGYISPFARGHVNTLLSVPIMKHHDKGQFEVFAYCTASSDRADEHSLRESGVTWRQIDGLDDDAAFQQIQHDQIDILIDLTSHMTGGRPRLLARKPAPVLINYLAYPATSGLKSIDYRVTTPQLDPFGSEDALEPERLIRLPETYWCYPTDRDIPIVPPPSIKNGFISFGCLNAFAKVRPACIDTWAQIVKRVAGSRLTILVQAGENAHSVRARFVAAGVDPASLTLLPYVDGLQHLERFNQLDVCFDPYPYGGHVTTHDALWMGVPVIAMKGNTPVSRAGECILSQVGLSDLVAKDTDDYIALAVRIAADLDRRADLRKNLRARMSVSPLCDVKRFTQNLEAGYRAAWKRWCEGLTPANITV